MKLLGIDFETTGPEPTLCDITEAAWVFYDTEFGTVPMISQVYLNKEVEYIEDGAEKVTGITTERLHKYGIARDEIRDRLMTDLMSLNPDYLVAHNAHQFDKVIFDRLLPGNEKRDWIDTMEDLPAETYDKLGTRTLEFMAARCGFLNPFPHAALPDVMTMMKVLFLEDVDYVAMRSKVPSVTVMADVSFAKKDEAKTRGYFWENLRGKKYSKKWVKRLKQDEVELENKSCPFNVVIID